MLSREKRLGTNIFLLGGFLEQEDRSKDCGYRGKESSKPLIINGNPRTGSVQAHRKRFLVL
jgi:hypothetical protein